MKISQTQTILNHLEEGKPITTKTARKLCKCERLAARISDLRAKGYEIETIMKPARNGSWYAEYWLSEFAPKEDEKLLSMSIKRAV